jgi:predicted transcriptional regulator
MFILTASLDEQLTASFRPALEAAGHKINHATHVDDIDLWLMQDEYDAILIKPEEGEAWARRYRAKGGRTAISFVTLTLLPDEAASLYEVADDVVRLPICPGEFAARLQAVVRRKSGHATAVLQHGALSFDPRTGVGTYNGHSFQIAPGPAAILEALLLRRGRTLTKQMGLSVLYGYRDPADSKIVDVYICKIRQMLKSVGAPGDLIETVFGCGHTISAAEPSAAITLTKPPAAVARAPAVPVSKSIFPEYLVCLEDGMRLRSLKRYLRMRHNLSPEQYRRRWGLRPDYPMVCPSLAKTHGEPVTHQSSRGPKTNSSLSTASLAALT